MACKGRPGKELRPAPQSQHAVRRHLIEISTSIKRSRFLASGYVPCEFSYPVLAQPFPLMTSIWCHMPSKRARLNPVLLGHDLAPNRLAISRLQNTSRNLFVQPLQHIDSSDSSSDTSFTRTQTRPATPHRLTHNLGTASPYR